MKREGEGCTQSEKKKRKKEGNDRRGEGESVERQSKRGNGESRVRIRTCVYGAYVIRRETWKSDESERGEKIDRRTNRLDGEPFETSDRRSSSFGP